MTTITLLDALTALTRRAEGRRIARRRLHEAVDRLAETLVGELRIGDTVTVDEHDVRIARVGFFGQQCPGAPIVACPRGATETLCLVDGATVQSWPGDGEWHDGSNLHRSTGRLFEWSEAGDVAAVPAADAATIAWTGTNAAAIARAFAAHCREEAVGFDQAAESARSGRV